MSDGDLTDRVHDEAAELTGGKRADAAEPFRLFSEWLAEAGEHEPNDPNAMALATIDATGLPDVRMVLLKGVGPDGFVFYTNLGSRKGQELASHPKAALCFHWKSIRRQVRVRGRVEAVTEAEADAYFATRPRLTRIGAWASKQSHVLESRLALEKAVALQTARFAVGEIPRPPHWSGFRVIPIEFEFWRDGAFRLHERTRYTRSGRDWVKALLYP